MIVAARWRRPCVATGLAAVELAGLDDGRRDVGVVQLPTVCRANGPLRTNDRERLAGPGEGNVEAGR